MSLKSNKDEVSSLIRTRRFRLSSVSNNLFCSKVVRLDSQQPLANSLNSGHDSRLPLQSRQKKIHGVDLVVQ